MQVETQDRPDGARRSAKDAFVSRNGLRALIALQAMTLVAVLASRPAVPEAQAQVERPGRATLPNAAEQRNEQIDQLKIIAELLRQNDARAVDGEKSVAQSLAGIERQVQTISSQLDQLLGQNRPQTQPQTQPGQ